MNAWLPFVLPLLVPWPATQACALPGNWIGNPLVHRPALHPLSHTGQGWHVIFILGFDEDEQKFSQEHLHSWSVITSLCTLVYKLTCSESGRVKTIWHQPSMVPLAGMAKDLVFLLAYSGSPLDFPAGFLFQLLWNINFFIYNTSCSVLYFI